MIKYILLLLALLILCIYIYYKKDKKVEKKNITTKFSIKNIGENTIWTYWDQGVENISPFSKKCIKTWKIKNPNHNVIIIDRYNVFNYLNESELPPNWKLIDVPQHKSDFVRLSLLVKYGGVWIDISTICIKPINNIFKQTKSIEGFAIRSFSKNNDLSVFENWFISCKKGSKLIKIWRDEMFKAFGKLTSMQQIDDKYFYDIDLQNISPGSYLTMHKIFTKCMQTNSEFAKLYKNDSNIFGAEETVGIYHTHFNKDLSGFFRKDNGFIEKLENVNTPILKFSNGLFHHYNENTLNQPNTVMYKLLNP